MKTPFGDISMLFIDGYEDAGISGMLSKSSTVKTDLNWLFKVSAISLGVVTRYFCEDNNRASGFMVDLAMGYHNEHPTMVGGSICKS